MEADRELARGCPRCQVQWYLDRENCPFQAHQMELLLQTQC
jgi:hypothetical protein